MQKRSLNAVAPALLLVAVLTGCLPLGGSGFTSTSSSSSCVGGECTATLTGAGADTELSIGAVDVTVTLIGVTDGSAQFSVGDDEVSCVAAETVALPGISVTCDVVGEDSLTLTLRQS